MKLSKIHEPRPHNMYEINKQLFRELRDISLRLPVVDLHLLDIASRDAGYKNKQELLRFLYRTFLLEEGYYDSVDYNSVKLKMKKSWKEGKYKNVLKNQFHKS